MCMSSVTDMPRLTCGALTELPELVSVEGMSRAEIRRTMRIVVEQQSLLLAKWVEIHG